MTDTDLTALTKEVLRGADLRQAKQIYDMALNIKTTACAAKDWIFLREGCVMEFEALSRIGELLEDYDDNGRFVGELR